MNILLLDDEGEKLRYISNYLKYLGHNCEQCNDIRALKHKVARKKYDVVIIDLVVPYSDEEDYEDKQNGYKAIEYLRKTTDTIFYPKRIVVLSRYLDKDVTWKLNSMGTTGIKYESQNENWKNELRQELEYISLISVKKADIVILTAVENEKKQIEKVFDWKKLDVLNDSLQYYYCEIEDKNKFPLTLIHCHIAKMGAIAASQATARAIELFEPECVLMCGIAGGRNGKTDFGDIIVAETAVDFASGSIESDPTDAIEFIPDSDIISVDPNWIKPFKNYKENTELLRKIRDAADLYEDYKNDICLHIGKIATGPAVIKSEKFSEKYIKAHNRQYIAIDMETYGVYYTARHLSCKYISIKSISDKADKRKDDKYQKYAALLAAKIVEYFIKNDYKRLI